MIDFRNQPAGYSQGIYDIPFETYRAIPALNSSKLKNLRKTPAHFKAALESPRKITPALQKSFDIGKAFDTLILNGYEDFMNAFIVDDTGLNKNTKAYKTWKASRVQKVLSKKDYQSVVNMREAAFKKKRFCDLFLNKGFRCGVPHRVLVWQCRHTGLWCKAELDWITNEGTIVDLKSTADAGYWFFQRNARRLGYVDQLAFYLEGLTTVTGLIHDKAYLAAVEVDPPYESHIFEPSQTQLLDAADENRERKKVLFNCLKTNRWPGYPDEIMCLDSGTYSFNETDEQEDLHGF